MKYWTCQFFVIFPNFCPLKERRKFSKLFGLPICGFWVVVPWKLAPKWMKLENEWNSNSIHLLYRALRTNSSCYCVKLGWYRSENTSFRITISENHCFPDLLFSINFHALPWIPHIKVIFFWKKPESSFRNNN